MRSWIVLRLRGVAIWRKTKCIKKKEKWGRGRGELITKSQIKYYWWIYLYNYSIRHSIGHSFHKKCHVIVWFAFLNLTIISSVILSIYTEKLFLFVYLWTNFTVGLIPSFKLLVNVTHHRTFLYFFCLLFPMQFPRYIPTKCFCWCLPMDIAIKNYISKIHRKILMEKFHLWFSLYSPNF